MASSTTTLATLAALLMLLVAANIVEASVEISEGGIREGHCRREIQGQQQLNECRRFLQRGRDGLEMAVEEEGNPRHPQQCCQQLRNMREDCRCEAIRGMAREMRGRGHGGGEEEEEEEMMMMRAENLPSMCGIGPRHCRIRGDGGY